MKNYDDLFETRDNTKAEPLRDIVGSGRSHLDHFFGEDEGEPTADDLLRDYHSSRKCLQVAEKRRLMDSQEALRRLLSRSRSR